METMNRSEEELYQAALINTQMKFPPVIKCIDDVVKEQYSDSVEANLIELSLLPENYRIYVISNEVRINGAVVMLYDRVLQKMADELESDLYILPSSIHEVLVVSADYWNSSDLANMVTDVNKCQLSLEERLSNQVYFYDRNSKLLSKITNSPSMRIDSY